ncbi:MAG: glycosyltransferase [Myxococcales bacterium]
MVGPLVREVRIQRTTNLEAFRTLDRLDVHVEEVERLGRLVRRALSPNRIWMLNSTETGGGVAEMMPRLCSLLNDLGVDTRWLVLHPDHPEFFPVTKGLHHLLHGMDGLPDVGRARSIYDDVSRGAANDLREVINRGDIVVVHDPQPVGAAAFFAQEFCCPPMLWRCHIGTAHRNSNTEKGWQFLSEYLQPFSRLLFSAEPYIPAELYERSTVLYPGIDPLSHKNRELPLYKLLGILRSAGLVDGPPAPAWTRFDAQVQRFVDGQWVASPLENLLFRPIVLQLSRFDSLKGYQHLMPAFADLLEHGPERIRQMKVATDRALSELSLVELVLAGPDPAGVADDPEAGAYLDELCRQQLALPEEIRRRVHLLRLPMVNTKQNALIVNALQRLATVVVQASVREGFGLTVAEALWKNTPVVATNVGGLGIQIRHGTDGVLVDDPSDAAMLSEAILHMLAYPKEAELMARSGRRRVLRHFLMLSQLQSWLEEFARILKVGAESHPPAGLGMTQ